MAQKLDSQGLAVWPDGVQVSDLEVSQLIQGVVSDDNGGLYVAFT